MSVLDVMSLFDWIGIGMVVLAAAVCWWLAKNVHPSNGWPNDDDY